MPRPLAIVGAASSIGIKPYDDGTMRHLHLAPEALRAECLVRRLGARDLGDVFPPAYVDFIRPAGRTRNERAVVTYSHALADRVATAGSDGSFVLVLGGDCSIVLGCLLGARRLGDGVGLVYVDAHADFATPEESVTGSAAAMCAALAVGRGSAPLASVAGPGPLVRESDVVMIGRRDDALGNIHGQNALRASAIVEFDQAAVRALGPGDTARAALAHLTRSGVQRFWIHVDADVLDASVIPAVDTPEPDGMSVDELVQVLRPLVADPRAIGLELTIYDPRLDPDRSSAKALVSLLERTLSPVRAA